MPDESPESTPTNLRGIDPGELLARGMQSVKMSSAGAHGWTPPTLAEAAGLFQNYEVLGLLGFGGMGAVYQARQTSLDRLVAIKLLPLEVSVDQSFADRFKREARAMAKLSHPNIVAVHDFGQTHEGHLFFVMEFVDGATLHQLIRTPGISPPDTLQIVMQVCDALAYAHGEGVVHRDIKPANVLVDGRGRVKVADFGLARLNAPGAETWGTTMTGTILGTPDYMAPEQKRGMNVDHRADIYALGVMLYEMLVGEVPQGAFESPSQRIGVDKRLDLVVTRALSPQPEKRYQSTAELKAAVEAIRPAVVKAELKKPAKTAPKPAAPPAPPRGDHEATMAALPSPMRQTHAKKSARWVGVAAVALVLGSIGVVVMKKSARTLLPTPPTGASATPRPASPVAKDSSRPPASGEVWQDALLDPMVSRGGSGIQRTAAGLTLSGQTVLFAKGPQRDGAVRAQVNFAGAKTDLQLLARRGSGGYRIVFSKAALTLQRTNADGTITTLGTVTPARQADDVFAVELRTVGSTITAKINGQTVAEIEDGTFGSGVFGIGVAEAAALTFSAVEHVSLEGRIEPGFRPLFDGHSLAGWRTYAPAAAPVWRVEDGMLLANEKSCLVTQEEFGDFDLRLEWRVGPQGNGGVFFRVQTGDGERPTSAPEFQLSARDNADPIKTGALYALQAATEDASLPTGQWNTARLVQQGGRCEHWVNGKRVCTYDFNSEEWKTLRRASQYLSNPNYAQAPKGLIGLQSWAGEVAYRNIRIRPLAAATAPAPAPDAGKPLTFGGHRYQFVAGALPWPEAQAKAAALGGHLATITSAAENAWLRDTYAAQLPRDETGFWLGGFLTTDSGAWEWVNGEEATFFSWGRGEPQRRGSGPGSEPPYYLLMYRSAKNGGEPRWHDLSVAQRDWNSRVAGFVVEWDKP